MVKELRFKFTGELTPSPVLNGLMEQIRKLTGGSSVHIEGNEIVVVEG